MDTLETRKLYIGGAPVDAHSGQTFPTINPATGEVLREVQVAGETDLDQTLPAFLSTGSANAVPGDRVQRLGRSTALAFTA